MIAGWRPGNGRRADTVGSLLLGVPDGDRLHYVGRVGSGFTDRDLEPTASALREAGAGARARSTVFRSLDARDAHWLEPELVGEVEYSERTPDGRLRHPVWRGWRRQDTASPGSDVSRSPMR